MSDISPVLTKVASGSTGANGQAQALSGSTSGVFASGLGGGNFWDMILSEFGASLESGTTDPKTTGVTNNAVTTLTNLIKGVNVTADASANVATNTNTATKIKSENPLALLQIALSSQTLDAQGNIVVTNPETDPAKLQTQLDLTNNIINQIKNMMPDGAEKDGMFGAILAKLQTKSDTLQASLSALENPVITKDTPVEDIPLPMLIALGLNPSEITQVTDNIQKIEEKLGRDITVEDLIAGVGGLIPPAPEAAPIAVASLPAPKNTSAQTGIDLNTIDAYTQPTDDLAAQLNALNVGGKESKDAAVNVEADLQSEKDKDLLDFIKDGTQKSDDSGITDGKVKKDGTTFKDNLVNMLNNTAKPPTGELTATAASFGGASDAEVLQQFGATTTSMMTFGTTAQAASVITSPATAGQAHPATQLVAATLTKAGKNGEDNIMTLRMDPPELGNVSIRMQFGKDKTVKAIISAEKPETVAMLQRDAHTLERALQSAGLDVGAESISFELQDHGSFAQDGKGDNDNNFGKGGASGSQNADAGNDIIQSSVAWQVDPSTGHVRYNIFA